MNDEQAREIIKKHCSIYGGSQREPARWILDAMQEAVAAEREACANLCEEVSDEYKLREGRKYPEARHDAQEGADMCANKIRARQEQQG